MEHTPACLPLVAVDEKAKPEISQPSLGEGKPKFEEGFFQLLKLEKFTTMITLHFHHIYNRSSNMNYFVYTSLHFTAREDMNSIN